MKNSRFLALGLGAVIAGAFLLAGCGGDDADKPSATVRAPSGSDGMDMSAGSSHARQAMEKMDMMVAAARGGKMKDAEAALEAADEHIHAVIKELESKNAELAKELDEAIDDAEKDMKAGEKADHIVEGGEAIMVLLKKAQ